MIDWNYKRIKEKKLYNVFLICHVFDYMDMQECEIWHKDFAGQTYAVSKEQAVNNIRFRREGEHSNYFGDEHCEMWYDAEEVE